MIFIPSKVSNVRHLNCADFEPRNPKFALIPDNWAFNPQKWSILTQIGLKKSNDAL